MTNTSVDIRLRGITDTIRIFCSLISAIANEVEI